MVSLDQYLQMRQRPKVFQDHSEINSLMTYISNTNITANENWLFSDTCINSFVDESNDTRNNNKLLVNLLKSNFKAPCETVVDARLDLIRGSCPSFDINTETRSHTKYLFISSWFWFEMLYSLWQMFLPSMIFTKKMFQ